VDFRWSEEQQELRTLARSILDDLATHDRLAALEADGDTVFDRDLWRELADAGILGVVIPEAQGAPGLACWNCCWCWRRPGARSRRCRWSRRWCPVRWR
jgi:3-oxocholest-4-en-26-oyl-CoA dehydrogenase beta subunit